MSTLKVDAIRHNSATSDAITTAADGTCTAKITGMTGGGALSHRNIFINGAMTVAQRGVTSTSQDYQTVDRMKSVCSNNDEVATQSQSDVASGTTPYTLGFRKAFKLQNGNQTSGANADDVVRMQSRLESQDIANSGWNYKSSSSYITLSFWCKSSVAQNFYIQLVSYDGSVQSYTFETGSLTADTWTKVTHSIPGNSNLQFDNDNGLGLDIYWIQYYGTDNTSSSHSLNSWAAYASGSKSPDMTTTWYTTNDATWELTGVQLEVGNTATSFEHRSYATEYDLCRRYYERWYGGSSFHSFLIGMAYQTTQGFGPFNFYPKRDAPTLEYSNLSHFDRLKSASSSVSSAVTNLKIDNTAPTFNSGYLYWNHDSMTEGQAIMFRITSTSGWIALSAEL